MKKIGFFCDGACKGNPGPGGWGAWGKADTGEEIELFGGDPATTNNRMELLGAIGALEKAAELRRTNAGLEVVMVVDSQYVKDGIEKWIHGWKRKGWKTSSGGDVKNRDLWERLNKLNEGVSPSWMWVRGHSGNEGNEKADALANRGCAAVR